MRKTITAVLLTGYGLLLFYLTLCLRTSPRLPPSGRLNLVAFHTIAIFLHKGGREMLVNVVGNLVAFGPLGFLWPLLRDDETTPWRVGFVSAAVSLLIETLQFFSGYRVADVDDVLLNTLGGLLGYAGYRVARRILLGDGQGSLKPALRKV